MDLWTYFMFDFVVSACEDIHNLSFKKILLFFGATIFNQTPYSSTSSSVQSNSDMLTP